MVEGDDEAAKAQERAEERRRTWTGGVAHSFAELDELDLASWQKVSKVDRVLTIWPLTLEALAFAGYDGPPPRLQRSAGGIRQR
jgi:hypothetical protein